MFLVVALPAALSHSALVRWVAERQISSMIGGIATMDSASISPRGVVTLKRVQVRTPPGGATGNAAVAFEAKRAVARLDWSHGLLSPRLVRLTLHAPVFRLSQSSVDGRLNLQAFTPMTKGVSARASLPVIAALGGSVELGEHDAKGYSPLIRLPISGDLRPMERDAGTYAVRFQGLPDAPPVIGKPTAPPAPTILEGETNPTTLATRLRVTNVDLAAWGDQWAPSAVRDQWRSLAIEGRLNHAEFTFTREAGAAAEVALEGVGLTLPVSPTAETEEQALEPAPPGGRNLRMSEVSGAVKFERAALRAALTGTIADLRYRVSMVTEGLALNAPFRIEVETAEPFIVGEHPSLLPFAPPIVRQRFQTFSGPTAVVEGSVTVVRGAPDASGAPPAPSVSGTLRFRDGAARYERFPYPISNLAGLVRFSDQEIRIESITGSNPSGARLHADGTIIPPTDGSAVDLRIAVVDLPVDEELEAAMPEQRKGLVPALFDRGEFARRQADGLLQTSAAKANAEKRLLEARTALAVAESKGEAPPAGLREEIDTLERRITAPVFDLGARATLDIHIIRRPGHGDGHWFADIRVAMARAGLMPRDFPYPIEAANATIHITDEKAHAEFLGAKGPAGGVWNIVADAMLMNEAGEKVFRPTVNIEVAGAPVEPLLFDALPMRAGEQGRQALETVRALDLTGKVSASAVVTARGDATGARPDLGFDAVVDLADVAARVGANEGELPALRAVRGRLRVSERALETEELTGRFAGGALRGTVRAAFDQGGGGGAGGASDVEASASVEQMDVSQPVEPLIAVFEPDLAASLSRVRAEHEPAGTVDVEALIGARPRVRFSGLRDASLILEGERLTIDNAAGSVTVRADDAIEFEGFSGDVLHEGQRLARASASGEWSLDGEPRVLHGEIDDLRLESKFVQRLARRGAGGPEESEDVGGGAMSYVEAAAGIVDGKIDVATGGGEPRLSGTIEPRSLTILRAGRSLEFERVSGVVTFDGPRGTIEGLRAEGEGLSLMADGEWAARPALSMDVRMRGEASSLDDRVRALLPEEALRAAEAVELAVYGPVRLEACRVQVGAPHTDDGSLAIHGEVRFQGASARLGAAMTDASGALEFDGRSAPAAPMAPGGGAEGGGAFAATLRLDEARVAGLRITDGMARLVREESGEGVVVPIAEATSHGGRIAGSARVGPGASRAQEFEFELTAAGVPLAQALGDLREADSVNGARQEASGAAEPARPPNRGLVDASLSLRGLVDDPQSREGRGAFAVAGGELVSMPIVTRLLELSNLTLPMGSQLRESIATFHIRGELASFDRLEIESSSMALRGEGAVRYSDWELDLRFTSRAALRLPIISDIFEGVRDEIATITVTGPIGEPRFGATMLAGTREALGQDFRGDPARRAPVRPERPRPNEGETR